MSGRRLQAGSARAGDTRTQAPVPYTTRLSPRARQVNGRGTAVMSSFCAALGMDAPVEVVNSRVRSRGGGRAKGGTPASPCTRDE